MKRVSTFLILAVFLLTGGYLWYTGGALEKNKQGSETITVVDNLDNKVTIPKKIDRIAVAGIFPFPSVLSGDQTQPGAKRFPGYLIIIRFICSEDGSR